ncbi:hypothetical protein AB8613_23925 [Vibrio sp. BS-M-Sm-2]|uniref:hypothetical protein n=1 Tax=Vibrio sp. BS-M-Sm-2 TaxID=3241167 RepID=UPI0035590F59
MNEDRSILFYRNKPGKGIDGWKGTCNELYGMESHVLDIATEEIEKLMILSGNEKANDIIEIKNFKNKVKGLSGEITKLKSKLLKN